MPTYNIKDKQSGEIKEMFLTLSEREELLADDRYEQTLSTPGFVSQHGSTISKADGGWKEVLDKVKVNSGMNHTIKT